MRRRDDLLAWASGLPQYGNSTRDRILLIVLGGLGDTILCEMLFWHLKQERPSRCIEVLTTGHVLASMPTVDKVFLVNVDTLGQDDEAMRKCLSFLNQRQYGEAIAVLEMSPCTGMPAAFSGLALMATQAPVRIGRWSAGGLALEAPDGEIHRVRPPARCFTHEFEPGDPRMRTRHESLQARHALGINYEVPIGRPRLLSSEGMAAWWAEEIASRFRNNKQQLLVGVNFEVTYDLKRWPERRFLQVMRSAIRHGLRFIVVGQCLSPPRGELERQLGDAVLDLRGKTDVARLSAIITQCDVFLSADAGSAHLAQALQVPTVVLFGPSNDREFGPRENTRHRLVLARRKCGGPPCVLGPCPFAGGCMNTIRVAAVLDALLDLVQTLRGGEIPPRESVAGTSAEVRVLP